jgi:hypothetical protein
LSSLAKRGKIIMPCYRFLTYSFCLALIGQRKPDRYVIPARLFIFHPNLKRRKNADTLGISLCE